MVPKFYTSGDIVAAFQSLDLASCLSLSNDSNIWWPEIEPVLFKFYFWQKEYIKESVSGGSPMNFCYDHC